MASVNSRMESIESTLSPDVLQLVNQSRDKCVSSWLTAVTLVDQGLVLNKQEKFRDSMRLRFTIYQASAFVGRNFLSATPCHAKRGVL